MLCEVCRTVFRIQGAHATCPSCGSVYENGGSPEVVHLESTATRSFEVVVVEHATTIEIIAMPDRVGPGETFEVHVHVHCNVDCGRAHTEAYLVGKIARALIVETGAAFETTLTYFEESVASCPAIWFPHVHGGVEGRIRVTAPTAAGVYTLQVTFPRGSPKTKATIPLIVR